MTCSPVPLVYVFSSFDTIYSPKNTVCYLPHLRFVCFSAELSFDLSPLTKADGGSYNVNAGGYDFYINVCAAARGDGCPEKSGACQVEQKQGDSKR